MPKLIEHSRGHAQDKCIAVKEGSLTSNLSLNLGWVEKEEQIKIKTSRSNKIINCREQ